MVPLFHIYSWLPISLRVKPKALVPLPPTPSLLLSLAHFTPATLALLFLRYPGMLPPWGLCSSCPICLKKNLLTDNDLSNSPNSFRSLFKFHLLQKPCLTNLLYSTTMVDKCHTVHTVEINTIVPHRSIPSCPCFTFCSCTYDFLTYYIYFAYQLLLISPC